MNLDPRKFIGGKGPTAHTEFTLGSGLSRYCVGDLLTTSVIEALPLTRLCVFWLDQKLMNSNLAMRGRHLAAGTEFIVSQMATLFMNPTSGWPATTGVNLQSGEPAYSPTTSVIGMKYSPDDKFSLQANVF